MRSGSTPELATIHLLTRALVDCALAQRIASERYPIQVYSVLRAAWEAARLIDLFHSVPGLADDWMEGKHWMFSPAKVRTRLGDDEDEFYAYMCARSHPRFAGSQMSIFRRVGAPEDAATHFTEIPFEIPDSFMAVAAPGIVLAKLAVLAGHVEFADAAHTPMRYPAIWAREGDRRVPEASASRNGVRLRCDLRGINGLTCQCRQRESCCKDRRSATSG
jgi:hypothetical protein